MNTVYTVSQVNQAIKATLESQDGFRDILIQGEISNYKAHSSGHRYFSLKDAGAAISAVMFRSDAMRLRFQVKNGMSVIVRGRISSYPKSGQVQVYVNEMMPDGIGALAVAFEQLKQKLYREGLLDAEHKRPIPRLPERIAVVTSPTGAAIRDILRILRRRYPHASVCIYPVQVQGDAAAGQIAQAIEQVNRDNRADVIITGRGGGSMEDLWAFNEEITARAIYHSNIPVISAVGHEPDITIADLVADARAATPSNAAEIAAPDQLEIRRFLQSANSLMSMSLHNRIRQERTHLQELRRRQELKSPKHSLEEKQFAVGQLEQRLETQMTMILKDRRREFSEQAAYLDAYSPLKVLARGYSVVTREDGRIVASSALLRQGDSIDIRFAKGSAECTVTKVKRKG
ncbi:MAG: exodeoxyribonuclease VII large subunit [Butyricicoccaceae bacterium]